MEDYLNGLRKVEAASADLLAIELRLDDESTSARALKVAEESLALAARDLTRAVNALPKRPKGWDS